MSYIYAAGVQAAAIEAAGRIVAAKMASSSLNSMSESQRWFRDVYKDILQTVKKEEENANR